MGSGVKDRSLPAGRREAKAPIRERCRTAASLGALQKSLLNQVGFVYVLQCSGILANRYGHRAEPDWTSAKLFDDGTEDPGVHVVQPELVHIEPPQRCVRDFGSDAAVGLHLGVVSDPPKEPVGHAWCATAPARDFCGA